MRLSRTARIAAGVLAATALLASPAAAKTTSSLSSTGVSFSSVSYYFDPWPCNSLCYQGKWAGMDYYGTLKDTNTGDGHNVFVHAKVDGYGYAARVYTSASARTRSVGQTIVGGADPAQTGKIQTCRDRGTLLPDNCAATPTLYR